MRIHINNAKERLYQVWEGGVELHQAREKDDGDGHDGASKTQVNLPGAQKISHKEEASTRRDKEGEDHLSMAGND